MKLNKTLLSLTAAALLYAGTPADAQLVIIQEPRQTEVDESDTYAAPPGRNLNTYLATRGQRNTPDKVWEFFKNNGVVYRKDLECLFRSSDGTRRIIPGDFMQEPIDTYLLGTGDCEDYAALAKDWLNAAGYPAKMIGYFERGKKTGHVVCAVKDGNTVSYLGCDKYITGYPSIAELIHKNAPGWGVYYELTLDRNNPSGQRIFNEIYRDEAARKERVRYFEIINNTKPHD